MGKRISDYIKGIKCSYEMRNIITVEHRSNNPKRDYLFCNKVQAKHIPANPMATITAFDALACKVINELKDHKVVVVGFAETATAIGAYISKNMKNCVYHMQTTRENCSNSIKLIEFQEEHSHATEQCLYGDIDSIPDFDYILFVEDEISTGKTILNFIAEFEKIKANVKFGVASICNWQNESNRKVYLDKGIDTFALITGELYDANAKMDVTVRDIDSAYAGDSAIVTDEEIAKINTVNIGMAEFVEYIKNNHIKTDEKHKNHPEVTIYTGFDPFTLERAGRNPQSSDYYKSIDNIMDNVSINRGESVLVLGTEECMYIPLMVARNISMYGANVSVHATTRSCIDVLEDNTGDVYNEIVNRFKLHSVYDKDRVTYVYNLQKYDRVYIITDGIMNNDFKRDIVNALVKCGNTLDNISFISYRKEV